MTFLPENRIFKALVTGSTVAVLICYAWLTAHLLEPTFATPADLVSDTFLRGSDGRLSLFEDRFHSFPLEASRVDRELSDLEPLINWLGALKRPVELLIDERIPSRLLVTDARIEIGRDVLLARGQLSKSILKAWILQNASSQIVSSHLRTEVASDALLAMLKGELYLEVPGQSSPLAFEVSDRAWWTYADSYRGVCESAWKSLELASLCENQNVKSDFINVSSLSFRSFLGSRIWKSYMATSIQRRLPFIRQWVATLIESRFVPGVTLKQGWLAVVQNELEALLPQSMDPLAEERARWLPKIDAPLIVIDADGHVAAPGTLKISSAELEFEHARMAVMTVCSAPSLRDVLSLPAVIERVVWRPECKEKKTDFVQVRPSAIRIALSRGLARASDKLDTFVRTHRETADNGQSSHWLGLADAKWDDQASAYQVHGAIQAVESFRLGSHN